MIDDTSKINTESSANELARQLLQRVNELNQLLRAQQEILAQRGMNLPPVVNERLKELKQRIEGFSAQMADQYMVLRHLRAVAETTSLVNSSLETDEVLTRVMDTVISLAGAERGFIMLKNRATGALEFTIARGIDQEQLSRDSFTISSTIVNKVAETGEPELTNNASDDPRYKDNRSVIGNALRSIIAVPLKVRGDVIGVIYCDNRFMAGIFKQSDLELLAAFATQAAVAIENARLFEAAREHLSEVKETSDFISNIFESIASGVITTDRDSVINTCNTAAREIIGAFADEVVGKSLYDVLPPSLNGDFQERLEKVRETGSQELIKAEPVLDNLGQRVWNLIISPLRDYSGSTQGVAIVLDDLTEIKQREAQLAGVKPYLPSALVDNILNVDVSGQERLISTLSADVRGFTSFSERLEPEELMEIINKYLSLASDAINLYEGVVDKYMGDAVVGLFNTQLNPQEDHAVRAVRAAMSMRYDLFALHEILPEDQRLVYGIGIHSGPAVLGNVGSAQRQEFAAIGDAMDISKILQENAMGGEIIISDATYELVKDQFECESYIPTKVKGHTELTHAYKVLKRKKVTGAISLDDF
jgi:PAS domain S-box-containing protein